MKRRHFIGILVGASLAPGWPRAQQPDRIRQIGILMPSDPNDTFGQEIMEALRRGLVERGWVEGNNVRTIVRWIGGDERRRRDFATELVQASPDVIFACFSAQLAALSHETNTIPIVFVGVTDPVRSGYVASLARPGGNVTGFTFFEQSLAGKWLELLKETSPGIVRVGAIVNPDTSQSHEFYLAQFAIAAGGAGVEPVSLLVHNPREVEIAIRGFAKQPGGGLIVLPDTFTTEHRDLIVTLASSERLPAVYQFSQASRAGGLMSYGPDQLDVIRRSASYLDRILRGEQAADLPVQAPTKFELVVNLRAARAIGVVIPPSLLARADEVIE